MALPNPTLNPPTLYSSSSRRAIHSRSPSHSPVRHARDFDPLLRDLSPTTTLRAFTADAAGNPDKHDSVVSTGSDAASPSERALGAKAAQACLDLRSWTRELDSWEWPGTFDVPEPARKKMRMSVFSVASSRTVPEEDEGEVEGEFWGSLPVQTVRAYERRTEEIAAQLEGVDVEELKGYALSAHQRAGGSSRASVDDSISSIGSTTDLRRLDDFTALITATILQALPYLSRLHRLLDVWTIRLSVLREASSYLHDLKQARTDLDHGWAAIAVSPSSGHGPDSANFTRETMTEMQAVVQHQVSSLGRRLDGFLDELEGREETLPEAWIEDFETLESAYGDWVVQAERKALENEWRMSREQEAKVVEREKAMQQLNARDSGHERNFSTSYNLEVPENDAAAVALPSSRPTSGVFTLPSEQQGQPLPFLQERAREDSETLPDSEGGQIQQPKTPNEALIAPEPENDSPTKHARYVPIIIDYDGDGQVYPADGITGDSFNETSAAHDVFPVPSSIPKDTAETDLQKASNAVKKRAAFLDATTNQNLQKQAKSPVRPFEHASNAFTRLFRKDRAPSDPQSRSDSQRSTSTLGSLAANSKRSSTGSGKAKKAEEVIWGGRRPPLAPQGSSNGGKSTNTDASGRSRSRSASHRSSSYRSTSTLSSNGVTFEGRPVVQRDYPDLPGGFRPRSKSAESQRARSLTPRAAAEKEYEGEVRRLRSLHRAPVETYKPTRGSSPVRPLSAKNPEQEYPADWPLASPPETEANSPVKEQPDVDRNEPVAEEEHDSGPETLSPRIPIETDVFDRMFVASFPGTPDEEQEFAGNPLGRAISSRDRRSGSRRKKRRHEPTLDSFMLGADGRQDDLSVASPGLAEEITPGSISTEMSEGEMQDARSVNYFHVQPPADAGAESRPSSSDTAKDAQETSTAKSKSPPVSPVLLKLKIPGAESANDAREGWKPGLITRASMASIESFPRSELKSIDLARTRRSSNASSAPQTPRDSAPVSAIEGPASGNRRIPASPLGYKGMMVFPSPPGHRSSVPPSPVSPVSPEHPAAKSRFAASPLDRLNHEEQNGSPVSARSVDSPAPLNVAMPKRQNKKAANGLRSPPKKQAVPLKPGEDTFDRHVSEVLERLPSTAIRFKSRLGAETPVARTSEPRNYFGPRPKATRLPSRTAAGGGADITLAPADPSPRKATSAAESEVKLYHLTQAGREEPIKLFVRLVGEGERVMVRVGGGWADLAEYLRQYAEHHGSRTVSSGGIELQTADGGRKVSNSALESKASKTPLSTPRPGSRLDDRDWLGQELPVFSMGDSSSPTDEEVSPVHFPLPMHQQTPTNAIATQRSTPKSTSTKAGSRPSTADSVGRPGSKQDWPMDSSLAGLTGSGKRAPGLPEQKARWVEGMIEKAKAASAERSKEDKTKYFSDMGKTGGTRRVIFRQSSGAPGPGGGGENGKP